MQSFATLNQLRLLAAYGKLEDRDYTEAEAAQLIAALEASGEKPDWSQSEAKTSLITVIFSRRPDNASLMTLLQRGSQRHPFPEPFGRMPSRPSLSNQAGCGCGCLAIVLGTIALAVTWTELSVNGRMLLLGLIIMCVGLEIGGRNAMEMYGPEDRATKALAYGAFVASALTILLAIAMLAAGC